MLQQTASVVVWWTLVLLLLTAALLIAPDALAQPRNPTGPQRASTAPNQAEGGADYLAGLDALERSRGADATTALTRAIGADSENPDYYLARGVACVLMEKLPQAAKDLERALRLRPDHNPSKLWLAVAVAMTGDFARGSTIYPFATQDLDESFVRQASHDYGEVAFRARQNEVTDDLLAKREVAKRQIAQAVALFASRAQSQPGLGDALLVRARELFQKQDYAAALTQLDRVLAASPEDFEAMFDHARCALKLGDYATARTECTRVLTAHTDWGPAYLARALAAAKLGDVRRAKADLATALRIDPKPSPAQRGEIERQIADPANAGTVPDFAALNKLAQANLPDSQLEREALRLIKNFNNHRRRYDENYQDRLRSLEEALRAQPKDPNRMVALGQFLLDEASVRRERVEPRGPYRKFRYQTESMESREVARAEALADEALALVSNHADALCLKGACQYWNQQFADAETSVRKAVAIDPHSPRVLELFARVLEVASLQKSAEAAALRRPTYLGSHDEHVGDYITTYTRWRYPSQAELNQANALDDLARQLAKLALEKIASAARLAQGKPAGFQLQGLYHWHSGELEEAVKQYQQAVKLAPKQVQWHYNLAALYEALGRFDESFQERLVAVNLVETTAGPLLAGTWDLVNQTKFRSAREALMRSGDIDVADSRVAAYLGAVAAAEENPGEAIAWFKMALALERARLELEGTSLSADAQGSLEPADYGLYLGVALRLAKTYLAAEQPAEARDLMMACLSLAQRVSRRDLPVDVPSALLPDAERDPTIVPAAENTLSLFAWLHVLAGQALVTLGDNEGAITVLAPVYSFEPLLQNGVGVTRLRGPTVYSSLYLARAYLAKGDLQNAQRYAQLLPRKRHGVGPSLGPFPELEEEGTQLQEQIAARLQGRREEGSETSDEYVPPDENKVNAALQKIGAAIGHPELGTGSRRFSGDAAEVGLCIAVTQAATFLAAPKSTRWRNEVLAGIAVVQLSRAEASRRAAALQGRPPRIRPSQRPSGQRPDPGTPRVQQNQPAAAGDILTRYDKAIELLKEMAISSGYPQGDLERDLSKSPQELLRMGR